MDFSPIMGPEKYGIPTSGAPASNAPTALASTVAPSEHGAAAAQLLSVHNPLTAYAALAAVVFGLMAFSTSVRVGKTSASLTLGDPK